MHKMPIAKDTWVHRGFLIRQNPFTGAFTVSKDGAHICSPKSLDDARKQIDALFPMSAAKE